MRALFTLLCMSFALVLSAQEASQVTVGDELTIGKASNADYQFLKLPKRNFVIKRNGVANFDALAGTKVKVTQKIQMENTVWATVERVNGRRFFGIQPSITVRLEDALRSNEVLF